MSVQITNLSTSQIRIVMTAGATTFTYDIYKRYVTLYQPGEPILTVLWHLYEVDTHQRKLDIDFNNVTVPVCSSAANLATQVQAFIDTIYSGSGGGYDTVEDEGTPLTQRTTINFTGAGVTASDVGGETEVNIPGGGGGTVTQVNTGTGLTGGPITGTGTIDLNSKLAPADSLTGNSLKVLRVNVGETAVEYATPTAAPSNASETVAGIVEEATQTETNAGTDTGATGAKLFVVPSKLAVWIQQAALTIDAVWHFVTAKLRLFNAAKTFYIGFTTAATANRSQAFQDKDGTIALTSDCGFFKIVSGSNFTESAANLANVTGLAFSIGANETFVVLFSGRGGSSGGTGGRFAITTPSGATLEATAWGNNTANTNMTSTNFATPGTEAATTFCAFTTTNGVWEVRATIINGATPGTVQLQARTVTSGTFTIYIGARMFAEKVN